MMNPLFPKIFLQVTAEISVPSLVFVRESDLVLILVTQRLTALGSQLTGAVIVK